MRHAQADDDQAAGSDKRRWRTGQRVDVHLHNPLLLRFAGTVPAKDDATVIEAPVADYLPNTKRRIGPTIARPAVFPPRHPVGSCGL